MRCQILGIQPVQFLNNNNEEIKGTTIYVAFKDENILKGLRSEKIFLKTGIELPKDVQINDTLDIGFNFKGKVESINKVN